MESLKQLVREVSVEIISKEFCKPLKHVSADALIEVRVLLGICLVDAAHVVSVCLWPALQHQLHLLGSLFAAE